jgi:hypothetical protein
MPHSRLFAVDRIESAAAIFIHEARRPNAVLRATLHQGLEEAVADAVVLVVRHLGEPQA